MRCLEHFDELIEWRQCAGFQGGLSLMYLLRLVNNDQSITCHDKIQFSYVLRQAVLLMPARRHFTVMNQNGAAQISALKPHDAAIATTSQPIIPTLPEQRRYGIRKGDSEGRLPKEVRGMD